LISLIRFDPAFFGRVVYVLSRDSLVHPTWPSTRAFERPARRAAPRSRLKRRLFQAHVKSSRDSDEKRNAFRFRIRRGAFATSVGDGYGPLHREHPTRIPAEERPPLFPRITRSLGVIERARFPPRDPMFEQA
jgi:hypothetical protein